MKDKEIFNIKRYHLKEFAESLGILNPPEISFQTRGKKTKSI